MLKGLDRKLYYHSSIITAHIAIAKRVALRSYLDVTQCFCYLGLQPIVVQVSDGNFR